jgi:thiamine-phosphate diphosphorylase
MLVTDASRARLPLLDLVVQAAAGGVDAVYLRDANRSTDDLVKLMQTLRAITGEVPTLLVSGGPTVARETGSGLHLRQRDMAPAAARDALGTEALIGRSVHTPDDAMAASGADYVLAGHVYPSASKPGKPPLGVAGLGDIVAVAPCPVIAIGGITPERVGEVIATGAHGIAVIGAIVEADDPRAASNALRAAVDHARRKHQEERP